MVAPVVIVMLTRAIRLPCIEVAVPIVAELPTAQKTAQPSAPLVNRTRAPVPVVSVEPIWKMNVGLDAPSPSSVSVPCSAAEDPKW